MPLLTLSGEADDWVVESPVSALQQRMLEDMAMRGLRSDTQHDYVRVVRITNGE